MSIFQKAQSLMSAKSIVISTRKDSTIVQKKIQLGEDESELPEVTTGMLIEYNKPEYLVLAVGLVLSMVNGTLAPAIGVILADALNIFSKPDISTIWPDTWKYVGIFVGIATIALIAIWIQTVIFFKPEVH